MVAIVLLLGSLEVLTAGALFDPLFGARGTDPVKLYTGLAAAVLFALLAETIGHTRCAPRTVRWIQSALRGILVNLLAFIVLGIPLFAVLSLSFIEGLAPRAVALIACGWTLGGAVLIRASFLEYLVEQKPPRPKSPTLAGLATSSLVTMISIGVGIGMGSLFVVLSYVLGQT